MLYFIRKITEKLLLSAGSFPAVVVCGARQVGKSTLLTKVFPNYSYVSLDLPSDAEQANTDPESFLKRFPGNLVIDEVQYAPHLFRYLKILIDKDRHNMGRFILTGSQKFTLMKEIADSLAGRIAVLNLENLSICEIDHKFSWIDLIHRGLFPELWRNPELNSNLFYSSYISTYLERDVRQIINVKNLRDFEKFLRACATRSGQLLNLADLSRDVGIKASTAKDWLSVLEATNQITLLSPYFENISKRLTKSPKLYLNDPGMLCFLLGLNKENLTLTPLMGLIWETFILSEFRKRLTNFNKAGTIWYYRDAQGKEIDFLEVENGQINLYEVKWGQGEQEKWVSNLLEIKNLLSRSKLAKPQTVKLITRIPHPKKHNSEVIELDPLAEFCQ